MLTDFPTNRVKIHEALPLTTEKGVMLQLELPNF